MTVVHGGNVYELAARFGCSPDDILDYSASINPLGPPPGLSELLTAHFHRLQHYPDIESRELIDTLARFHRIPPECIAVGNGSTEVIYSLPKALGCAEALAVMPTFGEYGKAFEQQGVGLKRLICSADNNFQPTAAQLAAAIDKDLPEAVLLTHPGSPSGSLLDGSVRQWILETGAKGRIYFIIDEVFIDFCEEESFKRFLQEVPNLVIIRSLTKFYGLPGLRIGYLIGSPEVVGRVGATIPPWSVNTYAQAAGVYCLQQEAYRQTTLDLTGKEREKLANALGSIAGFKVFPGTANYLLVEMDRSFPPAGRLRVDLFDRERILVRPCASFEGLDEWYFRVAVRLPEQNDRLIKAIRDWARYCRT